MGGDAFRHTGAPGKLTPRTPRMSPELYFQVKSVFVDKVRRCLPQCRVEVLKEGLEKSDYGDLDIIVAADNNLDFAGIANLIGAYAFVSSSEQICSFAVPDDGSTSAAAAIEFKTSKSPSPEVTDESFAQVDLSRVSPELLEWHLFHYAYGDTCFIFGRILFPLGFKFTNTGLWLRMKALDDAKACKCPNIKDSSGLLLLSHDPDRVMEFLGLSVPQYHEGFTTEHEFFNWVASCSLASPEPETPRPHNARERQKQSRPAYSRFFQDFLPMHFQTMEANDTCSFASTAKIPVDRREFWQAKALEWFGKGDEHNLRRDGILRKLHAWQAEVLLRPLIVQHSGLAEVKITEIIRALRRWVSWCHDRAPIILETPQEDEQSKLHLLLVESGNALKDESSTSEWIKTHWQQVRDLERRSKG